MVEPINMPFGLWTWVVPRNHVLGVALIPQVKGQFLWGGTPNAAAFCQFFDTRCLHGCVVDVCVATGRWLMWTTTAVCRLTSSV